MQSLCTLRVHCRQWPRNTHYQAGATPYLGRTFTGWIAPACGWRTHSITSSARASNLSGIVKPSAFAVFHGSSEMSLCHSGSDQALVVLVRTFPNALVASANLATLSPLAD